MKTNREIPDKRENTLEKDRTHLYIPDGTGLV